VFPDQPLVGDRPATAHRPAVAAGGKPRLGPLQRRPPLARQVADRGAGLHGVKPVGVIDLVAQIRCTQRASSGCQQRLEPGPLLSEQRPCPRLIHTASSSR